MADPIPTNTVTLNLDEEVIKLAIKDGVNDSVKLAQPLSLTRRQYYEVCVRQYWQGYDQGQAAGLAEASKPALLAIKVARIVKAAFRSHLFTAAVAAIVAFIAARWLH